jgi:4'-phosphopantetheinyl transferase EntD
MPPDAGMLQCVTDALGIGCELACARDAADAASLSEAERRRRDSMGSRRAMEWLRGRAALKDILARLGRDADTTGIAFPNPQLSLSHGGGLAVAFGTGADGVRGLGVDYEPRRCPKPAIARFFLTEWEQAWLASTPEAERPRHLLRLWTVKESVFKADPDNRGSLLMDYALDAPAERRAVARVIRGGRIRTIDYFSLERHDGVFSFAACPAEDRHV